MDAEIDALLADLSHGTASALHDAAATTPVSVPLVAAPPLQFSVRAASPFAPQHGQFAFHIRDIPTNKPMLLPPLPSHRDDFSVVQRETEQRFMQPSYVLRTSDRDRAGGLSAVSSSSTTLRVPQETILTSGGSRLLAQMPTAPPNAQLVPKRESLVMHPLQLAYEYRDVALVNGDGVGGVGATGGSAMINGFSKAMKENGEYLPSSAATRKPLAPGGATITEHGDSASSAVVASPVWDSADGRALNALVLREDGEANDDDKLLARLVLRAPGLDGCLTLQDLQTPTQHKSHRTTKTNTNPSMTIQAAGVNPKDLLRPYSAVASDPMALRDLQKTVVQEKAVRMLEKASGKRGRHSAVALAELFHDLESDEELRSLGFGRDGDAVPGKKEKEAKRVDEEAVGKAEKRMPTTTVSLSTSTLTTDAEIEQLLLAGGDGHNDDKDPRPAPSALSEWATMEPVDIHDFHTLVPDMAMQFNFELDPFQKQCIIHMERHECVFVAAHTSAGKTVVAEYAVALSQRHKTRVIYTSPIKALSNQKYRDFRLKFGAANVGLLTGDVAINPDASCLVMTTEILRSMLYRGADLLRDLEWVVFDEIHYINNNERGVVWEEVIIMLPPHVGMVFLSATTSNHLEFSDWIGRTKRHKIHVVSTPTRPVPLEHCVLAGGNMIKLFDTRLGFVDRNAYGYAHHLNQISGRKQSHWSQLVPVLTAQSLLPVVVFSFSRQQCESSANQIKKLDLCTRAEKSAIHTFLEDSIQRLQGSDRELPQVLKLKEMLQRGIAIHHSGLLPILKEMVEILFGKGLVKVLFATETFAMGVNMPARTVVFNGLRKHDGREYRMLTAGEYTQMAGRAGRRGLDTVGTVIIVPQGNMFPSEQLLFTLLVGESTVLESQFRLTYNMILNLLRVEVLSVEDMIKRSFSEFRTQKELVRRQIPQRVRRSRQLLVALEQTLKDEYPQLLQTHGSVESIHEFYGLTRQKRELERELLTKLITRHPHAARAAITPGRVVLMNVQGLPADHFALVLWTNELRGGPAVSSTGSSRLFKTVTVLCLCPDEFSVPATIKITASDHRLYHHYYHAYDDPVDDTQDPRLMGMMAPRGKVNGRVAWPPGEELRSNITSSIRGTRYAVLDIPESSLVLVTAIRAPPSDVNIATLVATSSLHQLGLAVTFLTTLTAMHAAAGSNSSIVPCVDIVAELQVNDLAVVTTYEAWQQLHTTVLTHPCATDASVSQSRVLTKVDQITKLQQYINRLSHELSSDSLSLFPDFQQRLSVLTKLGYISEDGVVQIKGRVACEIKTCDEIVLTELIFENVLSSLEPEEIVAVLSALVLQQSSKRQPTLTPRLTHARSRVVRIVESLHVLQLEQHLEMDPLTGYSTSALKFGLMEVVYEWARGMPFKDLCGLTDLQEGVIVRCIMRLDEVCRDVRNAARVVGDPTLYRKMEVASEAIKRDVVFASSLYLS